MSPATTCIGASIFMSASSKFFVNLHPICRLVATKPPGLAFHAAALTAPMGIGIGESLAGIEPNLGILPPISMRRIKLVVLHERRLRELPPTPWLAMIFGVAAPLVEAVPVDAHGPAYTPDGEIPRQYVDNPESWFPKNMNSFPAPPPFTVYLFLPVRPPLWPL